MKFIIVLFVLAYLINAFATASDRERNMTKIENNVCNATIKYYTLTEKEYNVTYNTKSREWCNRFPFRCTVYRVKHKIEKKNILEYRNKTILQCCEGYLNLTGRCIPLCKDGCVNGKCVAPDTCFCLEGWKGPNCAEECKEGSYGRGCVEKCLCENGATCDKISGMCHCPIGFTGEFCEIVCSNNSSGNKCENLCNCKNGGICNETDKSCECMPGYFGKDCKSHCTKGSFGKNCKNVCKCKDINTEVCSPLNGTCICKPGWTGEYCERECENNTWGFSCKNICDCGFKSTCHRVTGKCSCAPGWHGLKCEQKCPPGYYDKDCKMKCPDCRHDPGNCHHETGWCYCPDDSLMYVNEAMGPVCHLDCPEGKYGKNCENICLCTNNSTCHPVTGQCLCLPGWLGSECQFPCPEGTYGEYCNFTCNCTNGYSCNRFDGRCDCEGTVDDEECFTGSLLQINEDASLIALLIGGFLILSVAAAIIFILVKLFKRKKSDVEILKNDSISTAVLDGNSASSDGIKFTNPVYEAMDESMKAQPKSVAQIQPFKSSAEDMVAIEFKIPDCNVVKFQNNTSNVIPHQGSLERERGIFSCLQKSVDPPNVRYMKQEGDSSILDFTLRSIELHKDIALKSERHYEFPQNF